MRLDSLTEHPWILFGSIVASVPLIFWTFEFFFPHLREDLEEDGIWLLIGAITDLWVATWTVAKSLLFLTLCAAYVFAAYRLFSWLFLCG
jgi:hypothetical protein